MAFNPLVNPETLALLRKRGLVPPLGNDLPEDGGITGNLPNNTPLEDPQDTQNIHPDNPYLNKPLVPNLEAQQPDSSPSDMAAAKLPDQLAALESVSRKISGQPEQPSKLEIPPLEMGDGPQRAQGEGGFQMPTAPDNGRTPPEMNAYELAKQNYLNAVGTPAHKQGKAAQIGFILSQVAQKIGDNLMGQRNDTPIEWLGNAKRDQRIAKAGQRYAPLEAQRQTDIKTSLQGAQYDKAQSEAYKARLEAVRAQNPELYSAMEKKGFVDGADQKALMSAGYGYIPTYDARLFDKGFNDKGEEVASPKTGTPNYQLTGLTDAKKATVYDANGNAMTGEQRGNQQTQIAVGDANRAQQADIHNSDKAYDAIKTNASNTLKYNDDIRGLLEKFAQANSTILSANPELQGHADTMTSLAEQMQGYAQAIQDANDIADATDREKARKEATHNFNQVQDDFNRAKSSFLGTLGKTQGGQQLAAQLQDAIKQMQVPARLVYKPITASQVGGHYSGQVFLSPGALKTAFPGKSEQEIRQIVEAQGGRFQ